MQDFDVAVIGAGMVGVSTALWAQMRGHSVALIDPNPVGSGTSSGNACTLATYGCLPVNDPSVLSSLPQLLFSPRSPLSINYLHALRHPRWMLSFLANCRAEKSQAIAQHLATLLAHADAGLNPLIAEADAEDLVVNKGQLSVWSTQAGAQAASSGLALRRALGVTFQEMSQAQAKELEPDLKFTVARAVFYPDARHLRDPQLLIQKMAQRFQALGGEIVTSKAQATDPAQGGVTVHLAKGSLAVGRAVIAGGAFSKSVKGSGADALPLGTERGYHLLYEGQQHRISRPVGWAEGGFYAVPMAHGLRCAGTVEIAALNAAPNHRRLAYLEGRANEMFDGLPQPSAHWLGHRPTMPDSLPVIGHSPASKRIIHAFGHQHLGLTLGGITGRIVTDLIEDRRPNLDIDAYRSDRSFV